MKKKPTYKIIAMSRADGWYKWREKYIGKEIRPRDIPHATVRGGYVGCWCTLVKAKTSRCFYAVKLEQVS
jgi:hypothetical protein